MTAGMKLLVEKKICDRRLPSPRPARRTLCDVHKPGRYIEQASRWTDVVTTIRGKKMARLIPCDRTNIEDLAGYDDQLFGMWADRKDIPSVEEYVRDMRKGRQF